MIIFENFKYIEYLNFMFKRKKKVSMCLSMNICTWACQRNYETCFNEKKWKHIVIGGFTVSWTSIYTPSIFFMDIVA